MTGDFPRIIRTSIQHKMKLQRLLLPGIIILIIASCGRGEKKAISLPLKKQRDLSEVLVPIDREFSEYIEGYTSGIVSVNSPIEIRFTPHFASTLRKETPQGLFIFQPAIRGRAEWTGDVTLTFRPAAPLDPGTIYTGSLNLGRLADVKENLRSFPLAIQTIKKDFIVTTGALEASDDGSRYALHGELTASDYIPSAEVESYLQARLGRNKAGIVWNHSDPLVHRFTVTSIQRTAETGKLELQWDGSPGKVSRKGNASITIPALGDFRVIDMIMTREGSNSIDLVFSDPVDAGQEAEGLVWLSTGESLTMEIRSNIVTVIPSPVPEGTSDLNVETQIRNTAGSALASAFRRSIDFSTPMPAIELTGNGVIVPASQNLIFPFRAVNLKAVDLKIVKIFENNLPYFLQENEMTTGYSVRRFGRPVYSGRIDLINPEGKDPGGWNLYTIDLAEYINAEPGIIYRVELSMRPSYSLYPCTDTEDLKKYEEMIRMTEEANSGSWDDPDNFYSESDDYIYYSFGFEWRDRDNPCKASYFNPDRKVKRNIIASNFGIIAKTGQDNIMHVIVNDLLSSLPLSEVAVKIYDLQLQEIASGSTDQNGVAKIACDRTPFLVVASKDKDRNYLKVAEGYSLPLASFDVSGVNPEKGMKAFISGERDVWRPGDSIYLSLFIKDLKKIIPADHPVIFELTNPMGQVVDSRMQKSGGKNLLVFRTATRADAVTGDYRADFRIGGAVFSKRVRVETIKPNRLRIDINFPGKTLGGRKSSDRGTLNVKWLNGSTAGNLKTRVEYILRPVKTVFSQYPRYIFDDPGIEYYPGTVTMYDGQVDAEGNASLVFSPGKGTGAPGMMNVLFTARVAEKGGDESITQSVFSYAPYPVFAGIDLPGMKDKDRMLFTDRDNEVKVVTVDPDGNPVQSEAEITIYKISYSWWWESDREDLASYISNNIYKPVITKKINTSGGEGSFSFKIQSGDWGRYYIRVSVPGGHSTGRIILVDWPWENGMRGRSEGATLISVSTDRDKYAPGDEVKITFPAPENSRAIVTLENATSVIEEIRTPTTKGNTEVRFRARPDMAPNVYAFVTVIQPHAQTLNDMPIRLWGIVPVMVEDPATRIAPVITVPGEVRSQQSFEIGIKEARGKPMSYTLAVVDEGLLNITAFKTPDPWNHFYAREALGVRTWDLYDMVLGAFGGTLDRLLATGGDEALIDRSAGKAQRFEPVVRFLGPFTLGGGKSAVHRISLPRYTGSVRVMAIAGNDRAYGSAEKSVTVKDPLMILATAPRVVSPGEKVVLPVTLFVQKDNINSVDLFAEGNDMTAFDQKVKTISVSGQGEKDLEFSFRTADHTGKAEIKIRASGGGETAEYVVSLDVRTPNPPETRQELKVLAPGARWETTFETFGMKGTDEATLEASLLPSLNLGGRLGWLIDFPHGCTEQIVSAAFPQLWLNELSGDEQFAAGASSNISTATGKIVSRQMNNGGIVVWPGNYQPDSWVTSYAGHFMTEAERKGYSVPGDFKRKWINYQSRASRDWRYDPAFRQTAIDQAYRLFTLALAGAPERGAMNRLRETKDLPRLSGWLLAAAFAVSGRPEAAGELLDVRNTTVEKEYEGYFYGSSLRDMSVVLYTLSVLRKEEQALPLLKNICDELNSPGWYSTQSVAWGLFSYMKFTEMFPAGGGGKAGFTLDFNGQRTEESLEARKILVKNLSIKDGTNRVAVVNGSGQPVYINLVRKAIPASDDSPASSEGISMNVNYLNTSLETIDHRDLRQGTDFLMVTKVSNTSFTDVQNLALSQMVPSGWEIRNTRLFEAVSGIGESQYDYRDFRDDRVNTYFSLRQGETKTFVLILNAAYRGEFRQPAVLCEALYTEDCYARIPGGTVIVSGERE